jgi:peptidoglycan/LPS O-acetylase OafA/YrhL
MSALPISAPARDRYAYIDSIRGLAALFVVLEHGLSMIKAAPRDAGAQFFGAAQPWFGYGKFGVALFFIVSGFVVPFSLSGPRGEGLRRFGISRFFRLYPAYWLSLLIALPLAPALLGFAPTPVQVAINASMLQQFFGVANVIPVYWTLQIEMIFYVLCAALFFFGHLEKPWTVFCAGLGALAAALALAAARYWLDKKLPVAVPLALVLMFFGLLFRRGLLMGEVLSRRLAGALALAFFVAMPAIALLAYNKDFGFDERWNVYLASYYVAFLAFFVLATRARLDAPFFAWIGRISYSIYLFHPLVIIALREPLAALGLNWSVTFAIMVVAILAFCDIVYRVVEAPAVSFAHRWTKRARPAIATEGAPA